MGRYRVAQVGVGSRGMVHLEAFLALPERFELAAVCDMDSERLKARVGGRAGIGAVYTDAETMLAETRPDVFCFVTQPTTRLSMVELGARYGVRGMAFEKPMARSLGEARRIADGCREHRIKAVVSHQQKYLTSLQKVKELVDAGEIGALQRVHGFSTGSLTDLGTHYADYILWVNGGHRAGWVVGHAHGRRELEAAHPSPDFVLAEVAFANGVRGLLEIGALSPRHMGAGVPRWLDNRLTAYGTHGYAWGDTDGRWGAVTRSSGGEALSGAGPGYDPANPGAGWRTQQATMLQVPYLRELADWLDDDAKVHPCNVETAYHGFEILTGACLSALDHTRVDLPIADPGAAASIFERMRAQLPEAPPLKA